MRRGRDLGTMLLIASTLVVGISCASDDSAPATDPVSAPTSTASGADDG